MPERPEPAQPPDDGPGQFGGGWGDVSGRPEGYGAAQPPPAGPGQPGPGQPGYGQPGGPGGPGQPGAYGQYGPSTGGYGPTPMGPAPQPGIIPLRPLTLGEIYDGAFRSIRANPTVMFALSAVVVALLSVIQAIATWNTYEQLNDLLGNLGQANEVADLDAMVQGLQSQLLTSGIGGVVSFIVTTILTGLLIHSVSQSVIGRRMTLGEVWAATRPQIGRLLLLTLAILLAVVLMIGVFVVLVVLAVASGSNGLIIVVGLVSLLGMIFGALFVATVTVLATPALVLERASVGAALRRSFRLTMPTFWRVAGIYLLTTILTAILASIIVYPLQMISQTIGGFGPVTTIAGLVGSTVATALTTPFMAAVIALLYIDIRIRTEGLDLELARAAQEP